MAMHQPAQPHPTPVQRYRAQDWEVEFLSSTYVRDQAGRYVAKVMREDFAPGTARANALLLAAAPRLRDVLRAVLGSPGLRTDIEIHHPVLYDQVRDALVLAGVDSADLAYPNRH